MGGEPRAQDQRPSESVFNCDLKWWASAGLLAQPGLGWSQPGAHKEDGAGAAGGVLSTLTGLCFRVERNFFQVYLELAQFSWT